MLQIIIKAIFYIITQLYDLLFTPFFSLIYALFPDISNLFTYVNNYLDIGLTYFSTAIDLLCIPRAALILLFDYFAIKYSIYLIRITLKFAIKVYNLLKP